MLAEAFPLLFLHVADSLRLSSCRKPVAIEKRPRAGCQDGGRKLDTVVIAVTHVDVPAVTSHTKRRRPSVNAPLLLSGLHPVNRMLRLLPRQHPVDFLRRNQRHLPVGFLCVGPDVRGEHNVR